MQWWLAALLFLALACHAAPAQHDVATLVDQLRHDEQDMNAVRAVKALGSLESPPLRELHAALDSSDWQQRQLAAGLLWDFLHPRSWHWSELPEWRREPQGDVTTRLIEVTIEGFRDDNLPLDRRRSRYMFAFNAAEGFRHLRHHAKQAETQLVAGLSSDDYQQRFLCALVLGFGGVSSQAEPVARILLPHLRDNDIPEDAKWCTAALLRLGERVMPLLESALPNADQQQGDLIELLLLDLKQPPRTDEELVSRKKYNSVAGSVFDSAIQGPIDPNMGWLHKLRDPTLDRQASPVAPSEGDQP